MNSIKLYIFFFLLLIHWGLNAQVSISNVTIDGTDEKSVIKSKKDSLREIYPWGFDTNYIKRYNNRLAVSIFQSQRTFELNVSQREISDPNSLSTLQYIARSNKATGITIAYDKISFSLARTTPLPESEIYRKGITYYSDYSFSFTGSRYRLELSYRDYKGFYESNPTKYDSTFTDTSVYFKQPNLDNMVFKTKFIYFFNSHKFSYLAAYTNTYRQMKSAGSFFVYSDLFYNTITNPTGYFPSQIESYYGLYKKFNSLEAYGLTLGGGYSVNLVMFRSLYVNGTLGLAGQFYQQNTKTEDGYSNSTFKAGITGADMRGAIGYNGKNFFISATILVDLTFYNVSKITLGSKLIGGSFAYGYRFRFKERKWVKAMKNNKLYKLL